MRDLDNADDASTRSAIRSPEFWLLLVAAMAPGFGVTGWITIPGTVAGLLVSSLPKYGPLYPRAKAVGATAAFWATMMASVLLASIVSVAIYGLGCATWWLWGL